MFNFLKREVVVRDDARVKELEEDIKDLKRAQDRELETVRHDHSLEIKKLEFDMKNFKDSEILEKNLKIEDLTNKNAVLVKENEMMNKMVDINADIVDVKDVINQLIKKLPEINLSSLTVQTTAQK